MIEHLQSRMKDDVNGEHAPSSITDFPFHVYTQHHAPPPLGDTKSKRKIHEMDRLGKSQSCGGVFMFFHGRAHAKYPFSIVDRARQPENYSPRASTSIGGMFPFWSI